MQRDFSVRFFLGTFLFGLCLAPFALATQEAKDDSFSVEFGKGKKRETATATYKGWTYDQVWSATIKALLASKSRVQESDKNGGTITAWKQPTTAEKMLGVMDGSNFALYIEKVESGITISCQISDNSGPRKNMRRLFERIHELLKEQNTK
jgi:hypothetical protein